MAHARAALVLVEDMAVCGCFAQSVAPRVHATHSAILRGGVTQRESGDWRREVMRLNGAAARLCDDLQAGWP